MTVVVKQAPVAALAASSVLLGACVTPEQAERRDANAAKEATSTLLAFQSCYSASDAETENALNIFRNSGRGDAVYWLWSPNRTGNTLAKVNALDAVTLTDGCVSRMEAGCANLGLEINTGFVSRAQAALGRGEITVKCSPRLEQS
ncbi:MAG: hypothetical protein ACFB11_14535 [Paracoccaceae bacterium]